MWHSCIRRNMVLFGRSYNQCFIGEQRGECTLGEVINALYQYQYSQHFYWLNCFVTSRSWSHIVKLVWIYTYILFHLHSSSVCRNQLLFLFGFSAHNRSAQFTQGKWAETVICSAVVTDSSSRLDSFTTFSSQQSPTCLIVDLSDVWELYFWPDSRVCAWRFSSLGVCVCELNRCSSLPLASGVSECFHHFLSLLSAANSPARCNDSNSYNVHLHFNTFPNVSSHIPISTKTKSKTNAGTPASIVRSNQTVSEAHSSILQSFFFWFVPLLRLSLIYLIIN